MILMSIVQSCFWFDENAQTHLTGRFYMEVSSEGATYLYYKDPQQAASEPLLTDFSEFAVARNYLVFYQQGSYYLFSTNQLNETSVRQTRIGPVTKSNFRAKLYELTGDSTLQLASAI